MSYDELAERIAGMRSEIQALTSASKRLTATRDRLALGMECWRITAQRAIACLTSGESEAALTLLRMALMSTEDIDSLGCPTCRGKGVIETYGRGERPCPACKPRSP